MLFKLHKKNMLYFILVSLILVLTDVAIVNSVLYKENGQLLTIGISLDFVVVVPLLLYFFLYRKTNKKMISILPIALLGYIALMLLIPDTGQGTLEVVKYILIPMEIMFIGYIGHQIINNYRSFKLAQSHPIETLRNSLEATFSNSRMAAVLAHEVSIYYYAFCAWRKKQYVQTDSTSFSYHKDSNWLIIVMVLCKILLIEGILIHIVLMQWSHIAALLLSLGNIYMIITLIADYRAMVLNPILVGKNQIRVQYGIQLLANIDKHNIQSIAIIKYEQLTKNELKTAVVPLVTEPNVLIQLNKEISVIKLLGQRQMVDKVYIFLDKPNEFLVEYNK